MKIINGKDLIKNQVLNVMIYGAPGVGKTTFCATCPKPLIIDVEGGTISVSGKDVDIVQCDTVSDVRQAVNYAIENGYQTICIDSLTRYSEILMKDILAEEGKVKPQIQHWGTLVDSLKNSIWALQRNNINTVLICLEKEVSEEDVLVKRPNLNGQLIQAVPAILDVVGYLKINQNGERELCVNPTEKYYAKHRAPENRSIKENISPNFEILFSRIYGNEENVVEIVKSEEPESEAINA